MALPSATLPPIRSAVRIGSTTILASVDVALLRRLPAMVITGIPEPQARVLVECIRAVFHRNGIELPRMRIVFTVTLDGEDPPSAFDASGLALALCVALLRQVGSLPTPENPGTVYYGALSMAGDVVSPRGVLGVARAAGAAGVPLVAGATGFRWVLSAFTDSPVSIVVVLTLSALTRPLSVERIPRTRIRPIRTPLDFRDVVGHESAIQALANAARTRTPVVLRGPNGSGMAMLAARAPGLLPDLTVEDAADVAIVQEATGLWHDINHDSTILPITPPYRAPHYTVSLAGMIGNAAGAPGEVALAHKGVLFLDQYPEAPQAMLDAIRTPLTAGEIKIRTMGGYSCRFPAEVWFIAGVHLCPCGSKGSSRPCFCSPERIAAYERRWKESPLLQGALVIDLAPVAPETLLAQAGSGRTTESYRTAAASPA